jgi:hypothetical protein
LNINKYGRKIVIHLGKLFMRGCHI